MADRMFMAEVKAAARCGGCLLCALSDAAEDRYLRAILREGGSSERLLGEIVDSRGVCREHGWRLLDDEIESEGNALSTCCVFLAPVEELGSVLKKTRTTSRRRPRRKPKGLKGCPVCLMVSHVVECYESELLRAFGDGSLAAGGVDLCLCLRHYAALERVAFAAGDDDTLERVRSRQREDIESALAEAREYIAAQNVAAHGEHTCADPRADPPLQLVRLVAGLPRRRPNGDR